jgi:hypothetical protein
MGGQLPLGQVRLHAHVSKQSAKSLSVIPRAVTRSHRSKFAEGLPDIPIWDISRSQLGYVPVDALSRLQSGTGRAPDLAALIGLLVFDLRDAASLLGIRPSSLQYAAYKHRVSYVQYGSAKFFTRDDLIEYAISRGRGRESRLERRAHFVVRPNRWFESAKALQALGPLEHKTTDG